MPACEQFGVGVLPYFPLAYGLLTGKYRRGSRLRRRGSRLEAQANRLAPPTGIGSRRSNRSRTNAASPAHVAIGGLAAQPAVGSVICGATRPEQVVANVQAGLWEPSAADLLELDALGHGPAFGYTTFA